MIFGIGTDIVKIERIARIMEKQVNFLERVFTPFEIDYCLAKAKPAESFAARFAAKEAVMKALGCGWSNGINWQDIEVMMDVNGKPRIETHNASTDLMQAQGICSIHLSLAHEKEYAIAYVILEC